MALMTSAIHEGRRGVAYGLAAYLFWGFVPIYFKSVAHVPPAEVLAHRIFWSLLLMLLILAAGRRLGTLGLTLHNRQAVVGLAGSALLVAANWYVFIWAVDHARVLQASLGYFINPLVNVLLGFLFLRERLRPRQVFSVCLAFIGVGYMTLSVGQLPWIALFLATAFGLYGLLRKTVAVDSLLGQTVETALLLPAAIGYLAFLFLNERLVFAHLDGKTDLLLALAGVVTATPLLWFAHAARRLRLATLGFLQYIAPTAQLVLAVILFGEAFTRDHQIAFAFIWVALAVYSLDALRTHWRNAGKTPAPPPCKSTAQQIYGYCICQAAGRMGNKEECRIAAER